MEKSTPPIPEILSIKQRKTQPYTFVAIMFMAFFTAILFFLFFLYIEAIEEAQSVRDRIIKMQIQENEQIIDELSFGFNLLVQENESVAIKIIEEREKRAQEAVVANNQIEKLQQDLEDSKSPNLSQVINYWDQRVAKVECTFEDSSSERSSSGSAVLFPKTKDLSIGIVSSAHIFAEESGEDLIECKIEFPTDKENYYITSSNIELNAHEDIDSVLVKLPTPSPTLISLASQGTPLCAGSPNIGDSIVILGYPEVGSKKTVTATEGIISGIEDEVYITSAKVERGNSGGAAIHSKDNCYLGIPSFTAKGQVESLARILKHQEIFQ